MNKTPAIARLAGMRMVFAALVCLPSLAAAQVGAVSPLSAAESWLYGTDGDDIFQISPDTGETLKIGETHNRVLTFNDIAVTPDNEVFLVTSQQLYRLNRATGVTETVGPIGGVVGPQSLVADAAGRLWGSSTDGRLMEISRATGQGRIVNIFDAWARDLAIAPDGALYGIISAPITGGTYRLIRIDTASGQYTVVGSTGFLDVDGLAFGPDGRLFAAADGATLITIDIGTGAGSAVAVFSNFREMNGLGAPPFPPIAPPTVPGAPTLSGHSIAGGLELSWTAVAGAVSYVLEAGSGPGLANLFNGDVGNVTGLTPPAPPGTYYLRVRARIGASLSEASNEVAVTVGSSSPCAPPGAASSLQASVSGQLLTLIWNSVSGATEYLLEAGTAPGLSNALSANVGASTSQQFSLAGVPSGTYFVRVRPTNACGTGPASNDVTVTVP